MLWSRIGLFRKSRAAAVVGLCLFAAGTAATAGISDENGLEASAQKNYGAYTLATERYKDATGAFAASLQPDHSNYKQAGNYLIACVSGKCPADLAQVAKTLPDFHDSALPQLRMYLPAKGLVPHSERYILGPSGLAAAAPDLPQAGNAFNLGTEAVVAQYKVPGGRATLALFDYPTPSLARQELQKFQEVKGAVVKRSGSLLGVVQGAKPDAANQLLSKIDYQGLVSWDEKPPIVFKPESLGQMVLSIFELAGIVICFCAISGLVYGGIRVLRRKFGNKDALEGMIELHLSGK